MRHAGALSIICALLIPGARLEAQTPTTVEVGSDSTVEVIVPTLDSTWQRGRLTRPGGCPAVVFAYGPDNSYKEYSAPTKYRTYPLRAVSRLRLPAGGSWVEVPRESLERLAACNGGP